MGLPSRLELLMRLELLIRLELLSQLLVRFSQAQR